MFETIGVIGGFLFFVKIFIQLYIRKPIGEKNVLGALQGHFSDPMLILPIFEDVPDKLRGLKKLGNILYAVSIISLVLFLIAHNMK
jgi:hypothetical protein